MRVLAYGVALAAAVDEDHISVLQQKVSSDMLDRATRTSSLSSQLDAAVAGKKQSKCDALEAAELLDCFKIADYSALNFLAEGQTLDEAITKIQNRVEAANCDTLKADMRCMQMNPCYKKALRSLPVSFEVDGEEFKPAQLCKQYKDEKILDDASITWGMVCAESPKELCNVLTQNVEEVKADYETCGVTCSAPVADVEPESDDSSKFVALTKYNLKCEGANKAIKTKADCKRAAALVDGKKRAFRPIRFQKRPAGCFKYNGKVYWNAVRRGTMKEGRLAVCLQN